MLARVIDTSYNRLAMIRALLILVGVTVYAASLNFGADRSIASLQDISKLYTHAQAEGAAISSLSR